MLFSLENTIYCINFDKQCKHKSIFAGFWRETGMITVGYRLSVTDYRSVADRRQSHGSPLSLKILQKISPKTVDNPRRVWYNGTWIR